MNTTLLLGDCLDKLKELPDNSIDAIVTDPPYGLSFMGNAWDKSVPSQAVWEECLRVLKPGGYLLAFAGTRTQHRMAVAIEDAGFEIKDIIGWCFGSGFPKSHNISKALDKAAGAERKVVGTIKKLQSYGNGVNEVYGGGPDKGGVQEITAPATELAAKWEGWGTALKPAFEPITMARKPFKGTVAANVAEHGTGALNINGCRVGTEMAGARPGKKEEQAKRNLFLGLKNFEGNRAPGRWPANLIHDGSDEVIELFPETKSQQRTGKRSGKEKGTLGSFAGQENAVMGHSDQGSAARFFYCAKATKADRDEGLEGFEEKSRPTMGSGIGGQPNQQRANNRNNHPTVKPTSLMRYLCRLVTPPGGTILDPFMGSGSTGKAAKLERFNFVGIEIDPDYLAIAEARINAAQPEPEPPQQPSLFD